MSAPHRISSDEEDTVWNQQSKPHPRPVRCPAAGTQPYSSSNSSNMPSASRALVRSSTSAPEFTSRRAPQQADPPEDSPGKRPSYPSYSTSSSNHPRADKMSRASSRHAPRRTSADSSDDSLAESSSEDGAISASNRSKQATNLTSRSRAAGVSLASVSRRASHHEDLSDDLSANSLSEDDNGGASLKDDFDGDIIGGDSIRLEFKPKGELIQRRKKNRAYLDKIMRDLDSMNSNRPAGMKKHGLQDLMWARSKRGGSDGNDGSNDGGTDDDDEEEEEKDELGGQKEDEMGDEDSCVIDLLDDSSSSSAEEEHENKRTKTGAVNRGERGKILSKSGKAAGKRSASSKRDNEVSKGSNTVNSSTKDDVTINLLDDSSSSSAEEEHENKKTKTGAANRGERGKVLSKSGKAAGKRSASSKRDDEASKGSTSRYKRKMAAHGKESPAPLETKKKATKTASTEDNKTKATAVGSGSSEWQKGEAWPSEESYYKHGAKNLIQPKERGVMHSMFSAEALLGAGTANFHSSGDVLKMHTYAGESKGSSGSSGRCSNKCIGRAKCKRFGCRREIKIERGYGYLIQHTKNEHSHSVDDSTEIKRLIGSEEKKANTPPQRPSAPRSVTTSRQKYYPYRFKCCLSSNQKLQDFVKDLQHQRKENIGKSDDFVMSLYKARDSIGGCKDHIHQGYKITNLDGISYKNSMPIREFLQKGKCAKSWYGTSKK